MLPTRKIREIKPNDSIKKTSRRKRYMQYGGEVGKSGQDGKSGEVREVIEDIKVDETTPKGAHITSNYEAASYQEPDYEAPGLLQGLAQYSESVISSAVNYAKNVILEQLKIQQKPGETSLDLYREVNAVLQDPQVRMEFLEFAKNIADRGLTFIEVSRPLARKSADAFVEIFKEIAEKMGRSVVKIGKDVIVEIPVAGDVLGLIFLFDDIIKFVQSGLAAFFKAGTKTNEVIASTRLKLEQAQDLNNASPDIRQAANEVQNTVDVEKMKIMQQQAQQQPQVQPQVQQQEQLQDSNVNNVQIGGGKKRLLKILSRLKRTKKHFKKHKMNLK